jgi:hypothetical protein
VLQRRLDLPQGVGIIDGPAVPLLKCVFPKLPDSMLWRSQVKIIDMKSTSMLCNEYATTTCTFRLLARKLHHRNVTEVDTYTNVCDIRIWLDAIRNVEGV